MLYTPHYLASFGGTLTVDNVIKDIWNTNIRFVASPVGQYLGQGNWSNADHTSVASADILAVLYPKLAAFHPRIFPTGGGSGAIGVKSAARLEYLKISKIDAAGHYSDPTTYEHFWTPGLQGGLGDTVPWFVTAALSFTSDMTRGLGSAGRSYLPVAVAPTSAAPTLPLNSMTNYVNLAKALLDCFANNNVALATNTITTCPVIASGGSKKTPTVPGKLYAISGVRVGNVIDVQRRRKNALTEIYTSSAYSPA